MNFLSTRPLLKHFSLTLAVSVALLSLALAQQTGQPDLKLQQEAMKKLSVLAGKWSGGARWFRINDTSELNYTEDAHYEDKGLVLRIKSRGMRANDGLFVIGGSYVISYDPGAGAYRVHGAPDNRVGVLKIDDDWKGMTIDFATPPQRTTRAVLRVNEEGYWTEMHWVSEGSNRPWMFLAGVLGRQKETAQRPKERAHPQTAKPEKEAQ